MKTLKKSLIILLVVFIFDIGVTLAASTASTPVSIIAISIEPGSQVFTSYVTKSNYGNQSYYNSFTNTTLTSPCTTCPIGVKWEKKNGDSTERTVYMGDTKSVNLTSLYVAGEYRIGLRRTDMTLLSTYTSGDWTHN